MSVGINKLAKNTKAENGTREVLAEWRREHPSVSFMGPSGVAKDICLHGQGDFFWRLADGPCPICDDGNIAQKMLERDGVLDGDKLRAALRARKIERGY
ncbi:MAG: hypothetical protein ACREF7_01030 [Candidatus Saccharimonadales bacterium]